MSIINTLVTAMISKLEESPAIAGVSRVRTRPLSITTTEQIVVRPESSVVEETLLQSGHGIQWRTTVAVECYARVGAGTAPDAAVDGLLTDTVTRLMTDQTLGGAIVGMTPAQITYEFEADGDQTVVATILFNCLQRGATGVPI